jgi:hypothetical protein
MVGSDENGNGASNGNGTARARTIIVAGQSSQRTREVLHALRGFTNVIWPKSLESALEQTRSSDTACLVIADDLPDLRDHRSR